MQGRGSDQASIGWHRARDRIRGGTNHLLEYPIRIGNAPGPVGAGPGSIPTISSARIHLPAPQHRFDTLTLSMLDFPFFTGPGFTIG